MITTLIFLAGFLLGPLAAEEDRAAAEQSQGIKIAIANASQELSALKERQSVAQEKCSNIPADEPYPDEVRAECAKLKNKIAERLEIVQNSLTLLKKIESQDAQSMEMQKTGQSRWKEINEIEKNAQKSKNSGAKIGPEASDAKLSSISRTRFEKAFPKFAERMGLRSELDRLTKESKQHQEKCQQNLNDSRSLHKEAHRSGDKAVGAAANSMVANAMKASGLADNSHELAKKKMKEYDLAYTKAVQFQERWADLIFQFRRTQTYSDPVWEGKLNAIFSKLLTVYERKDVVPKLQLFNPCSGNGPCRPAHVASAIPGWVYVEKAYLDTNPSDAELAFVLAHEIAHIDCYHWNRQDEIEVKVLHGDPSFADDKSRNLAMKALMARHKIPMEEEADSVGQEYVRKTMPAYAEDGPKRFFEWLQKLDRIGEKTLEGKIKKNAAYKTDQEREDRKKQLKKEHSYTTDHPETEDRLKNLGVK